MKNSEFEWDDEKAASNLKKHGVSFDEGTTIFNALKLPRFPIPTIQKMRTDSSQLVYL